MIHLSESDRQAIARLAEKTGDAASSEECYLAGLAAGWSRGLEQAAKRCDEIWGKARVCCAEDADIAHAYDRGIASSAAAIRALANAAAEAADAQSS
jgi:hypothetical protein